MSTYTHEQFLLDVTAEATALKEHATKEELGRLDITKLNPRDYQTCIYGLCTSDCFSIRAAQLIYACCPRYFKNEDDDGCSLERLSRTTDDSFSKLVNGVKPDSVQDPETLCANRGSTEFMHYSAIEVYIMQPFAKNANLIAFLRDERKDLVL